MALYRSRGALGCAGLASLAALACCAALALGPGCKKAGDKSREQYARLTDELWAMAPADTASGWVIGDGAGTQLHRTVTAFAEVVERRPDGKELVAEARRAMRDEIGFDVLDFDAFSQAGIDLSRGAALFISANERVAVVVPVRDRAAFVARFGGTTEGELDTFEGRGGYCKVIDERYACAKHTATLDLLGKGDVMKKRMAGKFRGHIEVWARHDHRGPGEPPWREHTSDPGVLSGAMQLTPGGFTMRAHLATTPASPQARALIDPPSKLARAVAKEQPSGFLRFSAPIFDGLASRDDAARALAGFAAAGIDVRDHIIDNITGEMVIYSPPGQAGLTLKVGLEDSAKLTPAIKTLCVLAGQGAPQFGAALDGDGCKAVVDLAKLTEQPPGADMPTLPGPVTLSAYTEAKAVVISAQMAGDQENSRVSYDDLAEDLSTGPWNYAVWSQGFHLNMLTRLGEHLAAIPDEVQSHAALLLYLSRVGMGFAVREDGAHLVFHVETQFANPDEVLQQYHAIVARILDGDAGALAALEELVKKAPGTPLARTFGSSK